MLQEILKCLKVAFGEPPGRAQVFKWFTKFKSSVTSAKDAVGMTSMSSMHESKDK
jgi:hypothetical protein